MKDIKLIKVQSSNILEVGHDEDTNTLVVVFKNGSSYEYDNVPKAVYSEMINSDSVGKYYSSNIRGKYNSNKL